MLFLSLRHNYDWRMLDEGEREMSRANSDQSGGAQLSMQGKKI